MLAPDWLEALDRRHLSDLTTSEVARALRALSSCYVERRAKLTGGGALDSRGKRAAFALFYGPLHYCVVTEIVRALGAGECGITEVIDLGCGTGTAGAAVALHVRATRISGVDRNPWAVAEANWTYGAFGLRGRAVRGDVGRFRTQTGEGAGIVTAYTVNELADDVRGGLLAELLRASRRGARVLIVEPIARRMAPWWGEWQSTFGEAGGRSDEWRFGTELPARQRELARAAGLDPRELTARTLWL
jgi:hypothetical protein